MGLLLMIVMWTHKQFHCANTAESSSLDRVLYPRLAISFIGMQVTVRVEPYVDKDMLCTSIRST